MLDTQAPVLNVLNDLKGKTFGSLHVLDLHKRDKYGNVFWTCQCVCGQRVSRRASVLRSGKFFSCPSVSCRFWRRVLKSTQSGGCWEWVGALTAKNGYGVFHPPQPSKPVRAHVFSWTQTFGSVPSGYFVCHKCDNRTCVRPDHLFIGTHLDNMRDMATKGRSKVRKVHLSFEDKLTMVEEYGQGGVTHPELAARYGVSIHTVGRTLRGESNKETRHFWNI